MKRKLSINPDTFSLGDLLEFEDLTGKDMLESLQPKPVLDPETHRPMPDPDDPKRPLLAPQVNTRMFVVLAYLALRQEEPGLTYEEALKLKLSDLDIDIETQADPQESGTEGDDLPQPDES